MGACNPWPSLAYNCFTPLLSKILLFLWLRLFPGRAGCIVWEQQASLFSPLKPWTQNRKLINNFYEFSSVAQSYLTLCNPMDCSMSVFPALHYLLEFAQIHFHWISDAIQPSLPMSSPSPPAFNLSRHLGLFKWVSSSHQVAKVLEFHLQHQSFQWIFRTDLL